MKVRKMRVVLITLSCCVLIPSSVGSERDRRNSYAPVVDHPNIGGLTEPLSSAKLEELFNFVIAGSEVSPHMDFGDFWTQYSEARVAPRSGALRISGHEALLVELVKTLSLADVFAQFSKLLLEPEITQADIDPIVGAVNQELHGFDVYDCYVPTTLHAMTKQSAFELRVRDLFNTGIMKVRRDLMRLSSGDKAQPYSPELLRFARILAQHASKVHSAYKGLAEDLVSIENRRQAKATKKAKTFESSGTTGAINNYLKKLHVFTGF